MGKILCATRGGAESRRTQQAAIDLAQERGDDLVFLYVADTSFLDTLAAPFVVDIEAELDQMGRFQLLMAREEARERGIEAQVELRHGHLRTELANAARELGATVIVLGRPQEGTAVFEEEELQALAAKLQAQTGAQVLVV